MLIRTTEKILDYNGMPFPLNPENPAVLTTIRDVVQMALNNSLPNEQLTPEQKAEFYRLTSLFYSDVMVEVTVTDAALIENRAGQILTPLVCGRLREAFEQQAQLAALPSSNGTKAETLVE